MTGEDIRKLIGGYATGTLTEAERKALFDAALEDQDLFDELVREHALKEILEEPGVKLRLIDALAIPRVERIWWKRPIIWVATALLAAGVAAVSIVTERPPAPVQIAKLSPAETAPPPAPSVAKTVNKPIPAPAKTPRNVTAELATAGGGGKRTAATEAGGSSKDTDQKGTLQLRGTFPEAITPTSQVAQTGVPPPPHAPAQAVPVAPPGQRPEPQISSTFGGVASPASKALGGRPGRFAFDYRLQANGYLIIKVAGNGYLSVGATCLQCDAIGLMFSQYVPDGSTTSVIAPAGKSREQVLVITFSAKPESMPKPTVLVKKKTLSGALEDPNPTPDSTLLLRLERP